MKMVSPSAARLTSLDKKTLGLTHGYDDGRHIWASIGWFGSAETVKPLSRLSAWPRLSPKSSTASSRLEPYAPIMPKKSLHYVSKNINTFHRFHGK
jgi:hypothetical protein